METATNARLTSTPVPALPPVSGDYSGSTQVVSGTQMLPLDLNTLTRSNSSRPLLSPATALEGAFTGTQTSIWLPLDQPAEHPPSPAFRPMLTHVLLRVLTKLWGETVEMTSDPSRTPSAQLTLAAGAFVETTLSAWKLSGTTRVSMLRPTWASPDMLAEYTSGQHVFDAVQALYLSQNTPRDRRIAERLTTLYRAALEEDEAIRPASVNQFKDFFLAHPGLGVPKITLTPDGTLRVRWIQGKGNFVALEFIGNQYAKLVAEIPRDNGLTATHFGSEPLASIVAVVQGMGASFA